MLNNQDYSITRSGNIILLDVFYRNRLMHTVQITHKRTRKACRLNMHQPIIYTKNIMESYLAADDIGRITQSKLPAVDYADIRYMLELSNAWQYRRYMISRKNNWTAALDAYLKRIRPEAAVVIQVGYDHVRTRYRLEDISNTLSNSGSIFAEIPKGNARAPSYVSLISAQNCT